MRRHETLAVYEFCFSAGRGLGEKERMTPQNVAYWFSNRRKDIKRMAREGEPLIGHWSVKEK